MSDDEGQEATEYLHIPAQIKEEPVDIMDEEEVSHDPLASAGDSGQSLLLSNNPSQSDEPPQCPTPDSQIHQQSSTKKSVSFEMPVINKVVRNDIMGWEDSNDVTKLKDIIRLLRQETRQKDNTIRRVLKINQDNISKATSHIRAIEQNFIDKFQKLESENSDLRRINNTLMCRIKNLSDAIDHQSRTIRDLNAKLKTASNLAKLNNPNRPDVFYPQIPEMLENGVFVLTEGKSSVLCLKLPLDIQIMARNNVVEVKEGDIASVDKAKVAKRQATLCQVVKLLYNPLNSEMSFARRQHLVWILFLGVLNRFGFKSQDDKYVLRSNDIICLKPELVIKTNRPDFKEEVKTEKHTQASREQEIRQVMNNSKHLNEPLPEVKPQNKMMGPKSITLLPKQTCVRDVTIESKLLETARWNSIKGESLFNIGNSSLVRSVITTWHIPRVSDPKQQLENTMIGFLPALDKRGLVHIPFLVLPDPETARNSLPVKSQAINEFIFGQVTELDANKLCLCPYCKKSVPEGALLIHLESMHFMNFAAKIKLLDHFGKPAPKIASKERMSELWAFSIRPEYSFLNFPSEQSSPVFLMSRQTLKQSKGNELAVKVKEEPHELSQADVSPFTCRYCSKIFTSIKGWDAHVDSNHTELKAFVCPYTNCTYCSSTKLDLTYHSKFCCQFSPNNMIRPVSVSREKKHRIDSSEFKEQVSHQSRSSVPSERKKMRLSEEDSSCQFKANKINMPSRTPTNSFSGRSNSISPVTSSSPLQKRSSIDVLYTPNQEQLEKQFLNKAKRRQKRPQMSFTVILKDIIRSLSGYVALSKSVIRKERKVIFQRNLFSMAEIENRVDSDSFSTVESFTNAVTNFIRSFVKKNEGNEHFDIIVEVGEDLIQYFITEVDLRVNELAKLETEINPKPVAEPGT